jgi:formyltetrahydrofolate deformylase
MTRDTISAVLLMSCRDQKGLVAGTSDFIYRNDGNIVHADQHVDAEAGLFLQRIEWELVGFRIPRAELTDAFRPIAEKFGMQWELHFSDYVPRMAIFVSKLEHCLHDLLLRQRMGEFQAEIPLVISNHPDLRQLVETFGPQYHFYPITEETRAEQEKKQIELLEAQRIDLVVLARYMQILGGDFVRRFGNRIINIHHSFLPAFPGGRPYHQAYERGVKIIGATSHYATEELDQGPIVEQDVARVSHRDSVEDLIRKGRDLEKVVLSRAVSLHLAHRILVYGNKTVVFD